MDTMTINISLPKSLYLEAKKKVKARGYTSVSELIREAIRKVVYPNITVNGFTREFEDAVLKSEKEPTKNDRRWDGKTDFTDFVLKNTK